MAKEIVTVDSILGTLQRWVEERQPIDASTWLDASAKLTVLVSDIQNDLFLLEQKIAQKKLEFIDGGDSVAKAKVRIEGTDEFRHARGLEAKIDRVTELVRVAKLQARMSSDNLRSY
jgi:hypothetical protein